MSFTNKTEESLQMVPIQEDPRRFLVSKRVLLTDAFMTLFIRGGGIMVILAVAGIFFFILSQILPLFQGAHVKAISSVETAALPAGGYVALDTDEWAEMPMAVRKDGLVVFADLEGKRGLIEKSPDWLQAGDKVSALELNSKASLIAAGTAGGMVHLLSFGYKAEFKGKQRTIVESLSEEFNEVIAEGMEVREITVGQSEGVRLIGALVENDAKQGLFVQMLERKRSLLGAGKWVASEKIELTDKLPEGGRIRQIMATNRGDALIAIDESGQVLYFYRSGDDFDLRQQFEPFGDASEKRIATAGFLQGEVSLVFVSRDGDNRVFSLLRTEKEPVRKFYHTKTLKNLGGPADYFAASQRNKAFLLGEGTHVSLRFATSEEVRWEGDLPWEVQQGALSSKYKALVFLDTEGKFHRYDLDDPHPEVGMRAFFGKVWYEGAPEPKYEWQSTGGTDDFEPKLSMIPLIFGSLKGTWYAMMFSVPIALFGAMYTSEFLHPNHKVIIKPVMEIMASLPSVVLGFMGALWLAPLIEDKVPSMLMVLILVSLGSFLVGWIWSTQPMTICKWVPQGQEFLYFIPLLVLLTWVGWQLGPALEGMVFTIKDPDTGKKVADFTRWWPTVTGTSYQQRNSLVVGFMMGFAVIPIIFTIAEDAFSNVPGALRSGSLAMGASRWQTAWRIVLPTASAGIFSALMVGLGRAVGETMIMVMATGNTPIMEWNIFSGMRTLSANIAVELPEAPHHSTLYRSLFLGAFLLFMLTFAVNTIAEVLRQHLREKFKTI